MTVKLTRDEMQRYAPYNTFPEFWDGFDDYNTGRRDPNLSGIAGQAYARGIECATRRRIVEHSRRPSPAPGIRERRSA